MRALFLVLILLCANSHAVYATTPGEIEVGSYLRAADLHRLDGATKKFADYKGKPLIINVWASWCSPCRSEMASLNRLAHRYGGKQFNVIGISTDDDGNAAALFVKQSKLTFENFLDDHVRLENMLGANTIPLTLLVDANGRVLDKVHGTYEWDSPEIVAAIADTFHLKLPH